MYFISNGSMSEAIEYHIHKNDDFYIFSCGSTNLGTKRLIGSSDYLITYLEAGNAFVYEKGTKEYVKITAPAIIIFSPHESQVIVTDPEKPLFRYWVHCMGTYVEKLLENNGLLETRTIQLKQTIDAIPKLIFKIYEEILYKNYNHNIFCAGYLLQIIALITRGKKEVSFNKQSQPNQIILPAVQYIHDHFETELKNIEYANMCHLSEYHFIRIFKDCTGLTPHSYLLTIRISHAKFLLSSTDMTINDICNTVGYSDPSYFSYAFKKIVGISPNKYRKLRFDS